VWEITNRALDVQEIIFLPSSSHRESNTSVTLNEGIQRCQQKIHVIITTMQEACQRFLTIPMYGS